MDILTPAELEDIIRKSEIAEEYNEEIDRESAYELLREKLVVAEKKAVEPEVIQKRKEEESMLEELSKNTMVRQLGNTLLREMTRGLMGALGVKPRSKRRSSSIW